MIRTEKKEINKLVDEILKKNDIDGALEVIKTAQNNYYFDIENFLRGFVEQIKGNYENAIEFYKKTLEFTPYYEAAYNQIANCYTALGKHDEAIKWYNEHIKLFYLYSTAVPFFNRALTLFRKGEFDKAISDCLTSIDQNKTYVRPYQLLIGILIKLKKIDQALKAVDEFITVFSNDGDKLNDLGVRLLSEGTQLRKQGETEKANIYYEKARNALERGLICNPDSPRLHFNIACYYSLTGQKDDAIKELKKSIELDPTQKELATTDKDFEPLKDTKEFKELIAQ